MVLSLFGCANKAKSRLTEVEVAKPVRTNVPIYSEWIGTTVGPEDGNVLSVTVCAVMGPAIRIHSLLAGSFFAGSSLGWIWTSWS
jgi:hypothetical protein